VKQGGKYLKKQPQKQRARNTFRAIATLLATALCLIVTAPVMKEMVIHVGSPQKQEYQKYSDVQILENLNIMLDDTIGQILVGSPQNPGETQTGTETSKPLKKVYWLKDEDLVAPEPDQAKFGEADDPSELQWLLDEAAELLDGQELYFSTETNTIHGTKIRYYLDDTILAIAWKEVQDYSVYTICEVKIAHPSQFRRFLAGGEYGSEKQFITTEMAASVNAVAASSGDFYRFRNYGVVVYEGEVKRVNGKYIDSCLIDDKGDLHFIRKGEITDVETAQQYVDEHNIRFSLCFGPILVEDGVTCEPQTEYLLGETENHFSRAGLAQMGDLHYIITAANTQYGYEQVPNIHQFAKTMQRFGADKAYALDGGQTAVVAMNDELVNRPDYGYQRKISDIIYFATAIPDGN